VVSTPEVSREVFLGGRSCGSDITPANKMGL
jgi:hypothetical protein